MSLENNQNNDKLKKRKRIDSENTQIKKVKMEECTLMDLPFDTLLITFQFLTLKEMLDVSLVNKLFYEVSNANCLWKQHCCKILKMETQLCENWKDQFKLYGIKYPMVRCGEEHSLILFGNYFYEQIIYFFFRKWKIVLLRKSFWEFEIKI